MKMSCPALFGHRPAAIARLTAVAALLLWPGISSEAEAGVTDRKPLTPARSTLVPAGAGRVVAGGNGLFLVHGQRISQGGLNLDKQPIRGSEGYAVTWNDGWLILNSRPEALSVRHLGSTGGPEPLLSLAPIGTLVAAAGRPDRVAILESTGQTRPPSLSVTVIDGARIIQRRQLAQVDRAGIAAFGDGFLMITTVRDGERSWIVHAWRLDRDGTPQQIQTIGHLSHEVQSLEIAVQDDRAIVAVLTSAEATAWVLDSRLAAAPPVSIAGPVFAFPLSSDTRFFVSYELRTGGATIDRILILDREGKRIDDVAADPIVHGDRIGNRYLILRPFGEAAGAESDPRRIVTPPVPLQRRLYEQATEIESVVSGNTILVAFGVNALSEFVVTDLAGGLLTGEVMPLPADLPSGYRSITAFPEGFGVVWLVNGEIHLRRIDRRGQWMEPNAVVLATVPNALGVASHTNERNLLVAWSTKDDVNWSLFDFSGTPSMPMPLRASHLPTENNVLFATIGITGNDQDRLIILQQIAQCSILCPPLRLSLETQSLDARAQPLGPLHIFAADQSYVRGVGLPDGNWAIPINAPAVEILLLSHDGTQVSRSRQPMLDSGLVDFRRTDAGLEAIATNPLRVVEFIGPDRAVRLTGLSDVIAPHFVLGNLVTFLHGAPAPDEASVIPWKGRLNAADGDLAVTVQRDPAGANLRVTVRNQGPETATGVFVSATHPSVIFSLSGSSTARLPPIAAGGVVVLSARADLPLPFETRIFVLSDDVIDTDPTDSSAVIALAQPFTPHHQRGTRR